MFGVYTNAIDVCYTNAIDVCYMGGVCNPIVGHGNLILIRGFEMVIECYSLVLYISSETHKFL